MREPEYILESGTKIVTHAALDTTQGMLINPKHLTCRKGNQKGTIQGWVPGHGGDVYWVQHEGSNEVGAYCFTEFELDQ